MILSRSIIVADANWGWMKKSATARFARLLPIQEERMYLSISADGLFPAPGQNDWHGIIEKNLYLSAYATDGHYNDMDMLEIGRGLKPNEEEVHFGMWCIMSSPLLIGCDMNTIPDFSLKLLKNKELIALNQDVLGLQAHVVQHENESYVLVKDIERKRGLTRAVALYNPSDQPCDFIVPFETLELGGNVKVRDLIKQKDLGKMKEEGILDFHKNVFRLSQQI